MVRHDALVTPLRPHTKEYEDDARRTLGLAVTRAREAIDHKWRPSFARLAKISIRSLVKLEKGEAVGPTVYEAVARVLPGWTEDTPQTILEGGPIPSPVAFADLDPLEPVTPVGRLLLQLYDQLIADNYTHEEADAVIEAEIARIQRKRRNEQRDSPTRVARTRAIG